jgi:protein-disulfide isomerase
MLLKPPVSDRDHIQGSARATIELLEYGDYQCSFCGQAYLIVKEVKKKFNDDLKFVFRNFPLSTIHPQAKLAAIAAEAAHKQGKFWQMHDILFENQKSLYASFLMGYAKQIELNLVQFQEDLQNRMLAEKVEADFESGIRSGVNGTPGFFINGEKYDGGWDEINLSTNIKNKIEAAKRNGNVLL